MRVMVNHIAEFLIITKENKLPTVLQFVDMLRLYSHGDIPFQTKQKMIAKLSDDIFDESPVKESVKMSTSKLYSPSLRQRLTESDGSGTDSDQEDEQPQSGKMVQNKAPTDEEMTELVDELMRTPNRLSARDKEREEEQMEKFKNALSKLDKAHMVAIFKHIFKPEGSAENQGRILSSIFQSIDAETHSLIEFSYYK